MSLEHYIGAKIFRHVARYGKTLTVAAACCACQTVELARMRSHYHVVGQLTYPHAMRSEHVQGIGIEHYRTLRLLQLRHQCECRTFVATQSRTYSYGVVFLG